MFSNYLKTAWRNIWKNKVFSAINVAGLAVSIAAGITILLFVAYEKSFDDFHSGDIYRLNEVQKHEGMASAQKVALSMFPMAPTLKSEFPEITDFARVQRRQKYQATYEDKRLWLQQVFFTDSTFFQMFNFKLVRGDRGKILDQPNTAVITVSTAQKLFGGQDPVGKTIMHYAGDTTHFMVAGVVLDPPANSHMQFDALFSFGTSYKLNMMNNWGGNGWITYFKLAPHTNVAALEKKFPAFLKNHLTQNDNWKNYELFLSPLKELHAKTTDIELDSINYRKFDEKYTNLFFLIAVIVMAIACINFMNLSTARSAERAREVGIRKTSGASRWGLGLQFIIESVMLALLALIIAAALVKCLLPFINRLIERDLRLDLFNIRVLLLLLTGAIGVGIFAGLYPSVYLSSFLPARVLKGSVQTGKNKASLRNILVVVQFACAIFLIIVTVFAVRQLRYMQHRDPGFNRDQVLSIPLNGVTYKSYDVIKQELLNNSHITGVTGAQDELGGHLDQSSVEFLASGAPLRQVSATRLIVDHDYLDLYKISLVAGHNFSADPVQRGKEYIINETLANALLKEVPGANINDLLGSRFGFDSSVRIVGIARNFNFNSLHHQIESLFLFNQKDFGFGTMSVKIKGDQVQPVISFIQDVWKRYCPDQPFEFQFLDDHFAEVYRTDTQISMVVGILATLAIIVSCLGLFGLASYAAERRTKEIGIRKVLGASVKSVVTLLSANFLKYVFVALLIACPLAWLCLNKWLQEYAYRVPVSGWVFLLAGALAMLIAFITISFQAIRAASVNPVKSLRTE